MQAKYPLMAPVSLTNLTLKSTPQALRFALTNKK